MSDEGQALQSHIVVMHDAIPAPTPSMMKKYSEPMSYTPHGIVGRYAHDEL